MILLRSNRPDKRSLFGHTLRRGLTAVSTNGVVVEAYGYDALGRRAYTATAGVTNWMVYDGLHCVADLASDGTLVRSYTCGPGIDNVLAFTVYGGSATNTYFPLTDHLGTVHALVSSVDSVPSVVESYSYDAWGNVLAVLDANGDPLGASALGNRFLFQGREHSFATGLTNFRARWYDPQTGRWLSNDPIGISGGLNQYVFCNNDPVNYVDPWGLVDSNQQRMRWTIDGAEYGINALRQNPNLVKRVAELAETASNPRQRRAMAQALKMVGYTSKGVKGAGMRGLSGRAGTAVLGTLGGSVLYLMTAPPALGDAYLTADDHERFRLFEEAYMRDHPSAEEYADWDQTFVYDQGK